MSKTDITALDRSLARICEWCLLCRQARRCQEGMAFSIVKQIETSLCPFCRVKSEVRS